MYASGFVLAYHGCDESVGEKFLRNDSHVSVSKNRWDWLGQGAYFWENSPHRALQFVKEKPHHRHKIKTPFVVGAILNLGNCLDLTDAESLGIISNSYHALKSLSEKANAPLPINEPAHSADDDLLKRNLDCAVINYVHLAREKAQLPAFDTVRGIFLEGGELYPGAKIMSKTHVQICVRHPEKNITAYFRPRNSAE